MEEHTTSSPYSSGVQAPNVSMCAVPSQQQLNQQLPSASSGNNAVNSNNGSFSQLPSTLLQFSLYNLLTATSPTATNDVAAVFKDIKAAQSSSSRTTPVDPQMQQQQQQQQQQPLEWCHVLQYLKPQEQRTAREVDEVRRTMEEKPCEENFAAFVAALAKLTSAEPQS